MQSAIELKKIEDRLVDRPDFYSKGSRKAAYSCYMEIQLPEKHFGFGRPQHFKNL